MHEMEDVKHWTCTMCTCRIVYDWLLVDDGLKDYKLTWLREAKRLPKVINFEDL